MLHSLYTIMKKCPEISILISRYSLLSLFLQVGASAKFEQEIKAEQEKKKQELEEAKERRAAFKEKASLWH